MQATPMETGSVGIPSNTSPVSHNTLSSTPLRLVIGLCLIAFLPEICWALGLGLESARHGLRPNCWKVATGLVFTATLIIPPFTTFAAIQLTVIAGRFKQVAMGVLVLMWALILCASAAEVGHLHGYIGFKKRVPGRTELAPNVTELSRPYYTSSPAI